MKRLFIPKIIAITLFFGTLFSSCEKAEEILDLFTGSVTFYNNQTSVGVVTVTLNGYSDQIIRTKVPSACDDLDCASFSNLVYGNYNFTATAATGQRWSGTVNVNSSCILFRLY
jgi:hypothetical protein